MTLEAGATGVLEPQSEQALFRTTRQLLAHCIAENWAGYEPYDVLNSSVLAKLPNGGPKLLRLVLTQILKRSPINVRRLLFVPKTQNPKALGLFLSSLMKVAPLGITPQPDPVEPLIERLIALRSANVPYWCWGYNFPWQTRTVLVPRFAPNLVCTTFAAIGLLDVYDRKKDERCLDMAVSAAEYLLTELYWEDGKGACGFGYPLPQVHNQVHNANLLAADLLSRIYKHTGDERYVNAALKATRYSVAQQHPDGGWDYGEASTQKWIDNFHTGFNLCALRSIGCSLDTQEFESSVALGMQFYQDHFFRDDGSVQYFHDRAYPLDAHCVAQSIITLVELKDLVPDAIQKAESVFRWAFDHLWDSRKFFYYRKLRFCTIRTDYMRWTQAWMLLALTTLLSRTMSAETAANESLAELKA